MLPPISVIIPAFNEEDYLEHTVEHLRAAKDFLRQFSDTEVEIVMVDNDSTDRTADIGRELGLRVVRETEHNIAKVRNAGAKAARHDVLVFVDADTLLPREALLRIARVMSDPTCAGGALDVRFRPRRLLVRVYLRVGWAIGALTGMAMGACQFCRREVFAQLGGYDETIFMGEDVDFVWRLRANARRRGLRSTFVRDVHAITSSRRFDRWPLWKALLMTHPLVVFGLRRRKAVWRAWYDAAVAPR